MDILRYPILLACMAALVVPIELLDAAFAGLDLEISVRDTRGAGQVALYVLILLAALAFNIFPGGENPLRFFYAYVKDWRRALGGFAAAWLAVTAVVAAGYLVFALAGHVTHGEGRPDVAAMRVAERTASALVVMLVLVLSEELIFRATIMRYLRWKASTVVTVAAVLASAAIFAAAHNALDPRPWLARDQLALLTGLFLLGTLLATTYVATGSLTAAMGVHAGFLGSKVFMRKTGALDVTPNSWLLGHSDDLRMAPVVWLIFLSLTLLIAAFRRPLHAMFCVETPISGASRARTG